MLHRYTIRTKDGETIGTMEFATSEWKPGDRIHASPDLIVVEVIPGGDDELPTLIVE